MRHCPSPYSLVLAALLTATATPGWSQPCTWGGTPTLSAPAATALGTDQAQLRAPSRVAVDRDGYVYVADPTAGRVFVRDAWGRLVSVKQGLAEPLAIAVDTVGFIYVGEAATGSVSVFSPLWDLLFRFGQGEGEFAMPNHIAIDPEPSSLRVFVADSGANLVKVYSPTGGLLFQFGGKGANPGEFDFPAGIHVSQAGEIFVADQNNDRVQVFDRDGAFLRCFGGDASTQRFGRIQGVASDATGRVYVADAFQGSVWAFEASGAPLGTVGRFGEDPEGLVGPGGIAVDPNNRLLVASAGNGRVASYGLDAFDNPRALHGVAEFFEPTLPSFDRRKTVAVFGPERSTSNSGQAAPFLLPEPRRLEPRRSVSIEIRGAVLNDVRLDLIYANGVRTAGSTVGDRDANGVPEITTSFPLQALNATFPADAWATGEGFVGLTGEFADGTPFEATAVLDLRGGTGRRTRGRETANEVRPEAQKEEGREMAAAVAEAPRGETKNETRRAVAKEGDEQQGELGTKPAASPELGPQDKPIAVRGTAEQEPRQLLSFTRRWTADAVHPQQLTPDSLRTPLALPEPPELDVGENVSIEIRGAALDELRLDSIHANGVPAARSTVGDRDEDGVLEIAASFERQALLATFPAGAGARGEGFVNVTGEFLDGTPFKASSVVDLRSEAERTKKEDLDEKERERKEGEVKKDEEIGRQPDTTGREDLR